jgi:ABC-type sugar transport system permease subunit
VTTTAGVRTTVQGDRRPLRPPWIPEWVYAVGFVGPFLCLLLVFQYVPLIVMAHDSFYNFPLLNPTDRSFVGAQNYVDLVNDPDVIQSFAVTLVLAVCSLLLVVPAALLIAMFLNAPLPGRAVVRTITFLPVVTSVAVVATMWTFLLDPTNGLINSFITMLGGRALAFLTSKTQALPAIIVMTVWQQVGFAAVLFLAGLQRIPQDLLAASLIDGARWFQRLRHIIVPLLGRTTMFITVIMTVFSLQSFAPALIMTGGGPEGSTNFIVYHLYQAAFTLQQPGYASAISVVLLALILLISGIQMRLMRAEWTY